MVSLDLFFLVRQVGLVKVRYGTFCFGRCGALRYVTLCCGKNWFGLAGELGYGESVKLGIGMVSLGRRGKLGSVGIWCDPVRQAR